MHDINLWHVLESHCSRTKRYWREQWKIFLLLPAALETFRHLFSHFGTRRTCHARRTSHCWRTSRGNIDESKGKTFSSMEENYGPKKLIDVMCASGDIGKENERKRVSHSGWVSVRFLSTPNQRFVFTRMELIDLLHIWWTDAKQTRLLYAKLTVSTVRWFPLISLSKNRCREEPTSSGTKTQSHRNETYLLNLCEFLFMSHPLLGV